MQTQTQRTKTVIARQLSAKELYYYFFPRSYPTWAKITFAGGAGLLFLGGLFLRQLPILGFGLLSGLIGLMLQWWINKSNPNDAQYDAWVKQQAKSLYKRGLQTLGITESQLSDHAMWIQSYVLPGTFDADEYLSNTVHIKPGTDGCYRSSINVFTFIYPMTHSFAIFKSDVHAFKPSLHNDEDDIYPYRHIISATTSRTRETIFLGEREFPYQVEQFCLKLANGETIPLSATVRVKPSGSVAGVPTLTLPDTNFSWTLNKLRAMLQ
jgi:hypothetical protein